MSWHWPIQYLQHAAPSLMIFNPGISSHNQYGSQRTQPSWYFSCDHNGWYGMLLTLDALSEGWQEISVYPWSIFRTTVTDNILCLFRCVFFEWMWQEILISLNLSFAWRWQKIYISFLAWPIVLVKMTRNTCYPSLLFEWKCQETLFPSAIFLANMSGSTFFSWLCFWVNVTWNILIPLAYILLSEGDRKHFFSLGHLFRKYVKKHLFLWPILFSEGDMKYSETCDERPLHRTTESPESYETCGLSSQVQMYRNVEPCYYNSVSSEVSLSMQWSLIAGFTVCFFLTYFFEWTWQETLFSLGLFVDS